jgi:hypothetical protein
MTHAAQKPAEGNSLAGSPTARAFQQKPQAQDALNPQELLSKYKYLGEDHEQYRNLKEAVLRGHPEQIQKAAAELAGLGPRSQPAANPILAASGRFPIWNMFWVILISAGLSYGIVAVEHGSYAKGVPSQQPRTQTNLYFGSELLGGGPSQDFANDVVLEMAHIKPDHALFVGHQLAKLEIVEYLSAISRSASIKVLIGADATGVNQLENPQSPLRQYLHYADLRAARYPVRTQVLIAVNTTSHKGMALVGTYPYDVADASQGEHFTVYVRDYNECVQLYNRFNKLFPSR